MLADEIIQADIHGQLVDELFAGIYRAELFREQRIKQAKKRYFLTCLMKLLRHFIGEDSAR